MEVAPGIHRIQTPFGDRFICLYLLVGSEAALLVDTGVDATSGANISRPISTRSASPPIKSAT